jgi:hypothetical protein
MTRLDLFGAFLSFFLVAPLLLPLAPWLAKRPRGAWLIGCAVVAVLVLLFPAMFDWGCGWMNCGQGAIALFYLVPLWLLCAVITLLSARAAARKRAGTPPSAPPRSVS